MVDKRKLETISLTILFTICLISNIKCDPNATTLAPTPAPTTNAPTTTTTTTTILPSTCEMGKASKHEVELIKILTPIFNQKYELV